MILKDFLPLTTIEEKRDLNDTQSKDYIRRWGIMGKKKKESRKEKEKKAMRLAREKQERGEMLTEEELRVINKSDAIVKGILKQDGIYSKAEQQGMKRQSKRYNDRVWKGWRETDGITYPVTGLGGKSANKKK